MRERTSPGRVTRFEPQKILIKAVFLRVFALRERVGVFCGNHVSRQARQGSPRNSLLVFSASSVSLRDKDFEVLPFVVAPATGCGMR